MNPNKMNGSGYNGYGLDEHGVDTEWDDLESVDPAYSKAERDDRVDGPLPGENARLAAEDLEFEEELRRRYEEMQAKKAEGKPLEPQSPNDKGESDNQSGHTIINSEEKAE